ncbi:hypothetical protein MHB44_10195 [Lysinibacillus sp. FSL H8-0500]|uniref:hypothetical protein n=1 Tax=Lysinibacillus sp. FSL H8-0500 TaxID=2921393 RepID=UPI0031017C46
MYSIANFKILVDKQAEIDAIYQQCTQIIESTVTPKLHAEVDRLLKLIEDKLSKQGFTVTKTSTGLIANYQEATINVDKHSKNLEEWFFINLNSFAEDQVGLVLDISPIMMPKISNQLDGYTDIIEQMTDTLKQAKSLQKACTNPTFIYKTQNNKVFQSAQDVVDYYFQS